MRLWTYALREAQKRPGRALLTLLGISLGLATIVATRLSVHTIHRAYHELFEEVGGGRALEVTAPGRGGFPAAVLSSLQAVPGIATLQPRVQGIVALTKDKGSLSVPVVGICPTALASWPLREGRPIAAADEVLLDLRLAQPLALKPGDPIAVWAPAGPATLRVAGTLEPRSGGMGNMVTCLATAQRLFGMGCAINGIQVLLDDKADPAQVQTAVASRLPAGITVQGPGQRGQLARDTLYSTEQGLNYLSLIALVAASFVVLNTFMLNLGERRQQLAILRTLGGTRRQVMGLLLRETALFALAGTAAGWAAGIGLAFVLVRAMEQFAGLKMPALELTPGPFLLTLLLGPGSALAAAFLPAWHASRRQPLDELRPQHTLPPCPGRICKTGLLLLLLGVLLELALCLGWVRGSAANVLPGPVLAFILAGCVLACPLVIVRLLRLLETLPLGVETGLGLKLLARHPCRTGLSAGVLFLALAMAIGFGHTIQGIVRDLKQWFGQTITADFLVRSAMSDTAFTLAAAMPESVAEDIARCDDVAAVDKLSFVPCVAGGRQVLVMARTFSRGRPLALDLHEGTAAAVREGLLQGAAVLSTNLAQLLDLHAGDTITIETAAGPKAIRIAGTMTEYAAGGIAIYLEWESAGRLLHLPGVHCFLVSARPGAVAAAAGVLQAFCGRRSLMLQSNAELRGQVEGLLDRVISLLWGFMALAFLVAALGIVNTLTMNVQEQQREFAVLRALGLKGSQIRKLVLVQALLLGALGLIPGSLAGGGLAYVINCNSNCWGGHAIPFRFDSLLVGGCWCLSLATALLAALVPAWRVARLPVIRAMQ